LAFFCAKKICSILLCLAYYVSPVYSGTQSFFKDSHVLLKVVVFQIQVIPFISLALSVIVSSPVHSIMFYNYTIRVWPTTPGPSLKCPLDYRLQQNILVKTQHIFGVQFRTSSQNTFSPSLLFFKIYFS